jgi:hypothetical protein
MKGISFRLYQEKALFFDRTDAGKELWQKNVGRVRQEKDAKSEGGSPSRSRRRAAEAIFGTKELNAKT